MKKKKRSVLVRFNASGQIAVKQCLKFWKLKYFLQSITIVIGNRLAN